MNLWWNLAQAGVQWSPVALGIAAAIVILLLLILRFVIKTVITLVKIAIVVIIGVGAYLAFQYFLG